MNNKFSILLLTVFACNAKGVECANSAQPCVSTQVNDDSHDLSFDNTYDNDQSNDSTTINNDTIIINNPVINMPSAVGGAGGSGGEAPVIDAGVGGTGGSAGSGEDASVPHEVVLCDSPNAVGTDVRNWFTTNGRADEFFQLITFDGFSADRCVYTGKIKWYHEDQYGYWVSDRQFDQPLTTFVFNFEHNGMLTLDVHDPIDGYPNGYANSKNFDFLGWCYVGLNEGDALHFNVDYNFYSCIWYQQAGHVFSFNVFSARWDDGLSRPVEWQTVVPPNRG